MSRGALLTGTAGGIIGAATAGIGVIWSIVHLLLTLAIIDLQTFYIKMIPFWLYYSFNILYYFLEITSRVGLFFWFSLILAGPLIVSGILTGIGFYGMYKVGGRAMGVVGLIFGIIGGAAGGTLIIMGNILQMSNLYTFFVVNEPNYIYIYIGFVILAVGFILMGAASIAVCDTTSYPSASWTAGILSIGGACLFFLLPVSYGEILTLVGFALIFVAFVLWAVVFYQSRNTQSPGKS